MEGNVKNSEEKTLYIYIKKTLIFTDNTSEGACVISYFYKFICIKIRNFLRWIGGEISFDVENWILGETWEQSFDDVLV